MRVVIGLSILLSQGFHPIPTNAEQHQQYKGFRGFGASECSRFTEYSEFEKAQNSLINWAYALWSSTNLNIEAVTGTKGLEKNLFVPEVEPDALIARTRARCYEQPDKILHEVLMELYWELPTIKEEHQ